ncbi:serpin-ZX-like isoform X1 [Tasmannia lanceolata]|uniref:serpin-ZX-like isoform X1 n=1 Tax=Tasmannia lanceolata TaxID=3420 RepID=UPI00406354EA
MDLRKSIGNQTDFSLRIAKHILLKEGTNLVFSPSSIHIVLSLISAGSKGKTLEQLLSFLRSESNEELSTLSSQLVTLIFTDASQSGGPCISFVNGVWVEKSLPLKPSFEETANKLYKTEAKLVDCQTQASQVANEVNSWAENETNGLIKELLPSTSVDNLTKLIFANALYFKGAWNEKFDSSKTKDFDFNLLDGGSVQVPFMTSKKKQFLSSVNGFKVLTLPYKQGTDKRQFSMYFFLPDEKDGLHNFVEKLGSDSGFIDRHLPVQKVQVAEFRIPKFKFSFGFEVSTVLKELGLALPFSDEGDLTEMVDSPLSRSLYVSSISHKSVIEVNEEGTEAAAASAAVIALRSVSPKEPMDFVADHPFVFLIREDMTGVVLFIGHVLNPLLTS